MTAVAIVGTFVLVWAALGCVYWHATRDLGTRAAPRERTPARAYLRRLHLPRRAAQARTWAQDAIAQRIRKPPTPPLSYHPAGSCDACAEPPDEDALLDYQLDDNTIWRGLRAIPEGGK